MFTGLIQDMGTITAASRDGGPMRLTVAPDSISPSDLEHGESIAVSGPCLSVTSTSGETVSFDVGVESLQCSTAGQWRAGRRVHLERALRLGDRLGGHLVLGHVDGVGRVVHRVEEKGLIRLTVSLSKKIAPLVCEKGSIAVDGVSLTVNEVGREDFSVALIPETLERTTLGRLVRGDYVNLEADILARHLARMLAFHRGEDEESSLDLEFLARCGYL